MLLRRKLARLSRLSARERLWLVQGWLLLLAADAACRALPFHRAVRLFQGRPGNPSGTVSEAQRALADRVREMVAIAARHHLWTMACLRQVLAAALLLRRQGVAAAVRVGVQRHDGGLRAHAWVEVGGEPVGESPGHLETFQVLGVRR